MNGCTRVPKRENYITTAVSGLHKSPNVSEVPQLRTLEILLGSNAGRIRRHTNWFHLQKLSTIQALLSPGTSVPRIPW